MDQGRQIDENDRRKEGASQEDNDAEVLNPSTGTELNECGASGEVDRSSNGTDSWKGDDHGTDSEQEEEAACEARRDAEGVVDSS